MPIRNPFARRQADEGALRPPLPVEPALKSPPAFERVDTVGSKASSAISVTSRQSQDTGAYKMSVVNDSGVYLPPSPTVEKEQSWPRRYLSRTSTDTRSDLGEIEHFGISRESFDSYRRSFDISARSPVRNMDAHPARRSVDSTRFPRMPRQRLFEREPPTAESSEEDEDFEEVHLNDDNKQQTQQAQPAPPAQPKKRGFFSKFSDYTQETSGISPTISPAQTASRFSLLPSRKRAQSGQGAELETVEPKIFGTDGGRELVDVTVQA